MIRFPGYEKLSYCFGVKNKSSRRGSCEDKSGNDVLYSWGTINCSREPWRISYTGEDTKNKGIRCVIKWQNMWPENLKCFGPTLASLHKFWNHQENLNYELFADTQANHWVWNLNIRIAWKSLNILFNWTFATHSLTRLKHNLEYAVDVGSHLKKKIVFKFIWTKTLQRPLQAASFSHWKTWLYHWQQ